MSDSHGDNVLADILWLERWLENGIIYGDVKDDEFKEALERLENVKDRFQDAVAVAKSGR